MQYTKSENQNNSILIEKDSIWYRGELKCHCWFKSHKCLLDI